MVECRSEYLKPGNDGIKNTVDEADSLYVASGQITPVDMKTNGSTYDGISKSRLEITRHDI